MGEVTGDAPCASDQSASLGGMVFAAQRGQKKLYILGIEENLCLGTSQSFWPSSLVNDMSLWYSLLILEHSFMCCAFLLTSLHRISAKKEQIWSEVCLEGKMELLNLLRDTSLFIDQFLSSRLLEGHCFLAWEREKILLIELNCSCFYSNKVVWL